MTTIEIGSFLESQEYICHSLCAVSKLGIPDACISAGLIRNAIWDHQHSFKPKPVEMSDIDVVFCDHSDASLERDKAIEAKLATILPEAPWSVHNQARMYARNNDHPYRDVEDAIVHYLETPTAIGARFSAGGVEVVAPHGIDDLVQLGVRPMPSGKSKLDDYRARIASKKWHTRWPKLQVLFC